MARPSNTYRWERREDARQEKRGRSVRTIGEVMSGVRATAHGYSLTRGTATKPRYVGIKPHRPGRQYLINLRRKEEFGGTLIRT